MILPIGTILRWKMNVPSYWYGKRMQVLENVNNPTVKLLDEVISHSETFKPGFTFIVSLDCYVLGTDIEIVSKKPNRKLGDI